MLEEKGLAGSSRRIDPLAGRRGDRPAAPAGSPADALVFTGPGGGSGVAAEARTALSRDNLRRAYYAALARVTDPSAQLGYTPRLVPRALREIGGVG